MKMRAKKIQERRRGERWKDYEDTKGRKRKMGMVRDKDEEREEKRTRSVGGINYVRKRQIEEGEGRVGGRETKIESED